MAQASFPGKSYINKEQIDKYGSLIGGAISLFGLLIFAIGLLFDWLKNGEGYSGIKILTDNDLAGIRGGVLNSFLCNMPIFLCGTFVVATLMIVGVFWKKVPSNTKKYGPIALGVLTLLSCCPGLLFFLDLQTRDILGAVKLGFGYFISVFGLAIIVIGGLVSIGIAVYNGNLFRKRSL